MKILVTGNMGYIGPSVVHRLRSSYPGASILGLDMGYFAHCLTNAAFFPECRVDVQFIGDMRNFPHSILDGVTAIVHLAAISNDPMGEEFEEITLDVNYRASVALAKTAKQLGVNTFVFASSCSMYGSADDAPRAEDSPLKPLTAYAKSKVYTEEKISELADKNFKVTSLRFATACGMSERLRLDLVLNDFLAGAVASKEITILSDGTPWRPLIDINDMARAIDWAIARDNLNGGDFVAVNVGSDAWNYQVKDLANAVAKIVPDVKVSINKDGQPDKRSYKVNFNLFKKLAPDYQPKVNLTSSIKALKIGLEEMHFSDGNFRNSKFMRLKALKYLCSKEILNENLEWFHSISKD